MEALPSQIKQVAETPFQLEEAGSAGLSTDQLTQDHKKLVDTDLKKRINLFYHPLFQGALAQWLLLLLQHSDNSKCRKRDYLRLNIRVQKSLIIEFDFEAAQNSALEDWKIDYERQKQDQQLQNSEQQQEEKKEESSQETETLNYERLCEFFFDLCVSWCQFLDIETFLFFLHALFLNMTKGDTLATSSFKHLDSTEVMPLKFFNLLLGARNKCAERQRTEHFERYYQWARYNMHRTHEIASNVQKLLQQLYKGQDGICEEARVDELFPDFETEISQNFIEQHIEKLDRNLDHISKNTTFFMSTFYKQNLRIQDRTKKDSSQKRSIMQSAAIEHSGITATLEPRPMPLSGQTLTREDKERIIEQRVIDAAPPYLEQGRLEEIRETSFLIMNEKRLPLFGRAISLFPRQLRSTIGGAPSSVKFLDGDKDTTLQARLALKSKSPKDTDLISGKQHTDFDQTEFEFGRSTSQQRKQSGQIIGVQSAQNVGPQAQNKIKGTSSDKSPPKRQSQKLKPLKRVISPISKTDHSLGGVSSSMLELAPPPIVPPSQVKQIVVVQSKKGASPEKKEKKKKTTGRKQPATQEINITVPETKVGSPERQQLTNYNKPIVSGLSLASSVEDAQRYRSGSLLNADQKKNSDFDRSGPPPNATGSQFGGELAISPNLISESTLKTIYDKYLERSPPNGSEGDYKTKPLLSMESLRVALRNEGKLGGASSDFNEVKLAEILKEEGLLVEYPQRPKSFFARPMPQLKIKESSSGDKILATGGVTGSTQFQFLKGLSREGRGTEMEEEDEDETSKEEYEVMKEYASDSQEEENQRTARRMELIRIMLYKFQQRKREAKIGSENQLADYASVAQLQQAEVSLRGRPRETQYESRGGPETTAFSPTFYSPIGTTMAVGRRSPSLGSKILDAQLNEMAPREEKFERSPPKARKLREQIKYGVQAEWKKKFNPADILNKKFYEKNPSHYGRIMKKKIPQEAKVMAETIRQHYERGAETQPQEVNQRIMAEGEFDASRQTSPPVADYEMYGYAPKYDSSPAQQPIQKGMSISQSRKAIPLSNYAVVESLSLQSSSPKVHGRPSGFGAALIQKAEKLPTEEQSKSYVGKSPKDEMQGNPLTQTTHFRDTKAMKDSSLAIGKLESEITDNPRTSVAQAGSQDAKKNPSEINIPYVQVLPRSDQSFEAADASPGLQPIRTTSADQTTPGISPRRLDIKSAPLSKYRAEPYDIEEYEHLFPHGHIPESLKGIIDPLEFNYLLVKLKKDFNEANRSKFLTYMQLNFPEYVSRRDELGGIISESDYYVFSKRLGMLFERVYKKRVKMLKRKKRLHSRKLVPRSLIKRPVGPNMGKDPLWKSVFIHSDMGKKKMQIELLKEEEDPDRPFYLPPLINKSSLT